LATAGSAERFASNLLTEGKVVVEAPLLCDASILDSEDRQFVDLNATTAGRHACERAEMSTRRMISNGHSVFVNDHVVNVLPPVREADTKPLDCSSIPSCPSRDGTAPQPFGIWAAKFSAYTSWIDLTSPVLQMSCKRWISACFSRLVIV
jgi:hypothetical protein